MTGFLKIPSYRPKWLRNHEYRSGQTFYMCPGKIQKLSLCLPTILSWPADVNYQCCGFYYFGLIKVPLVFQWFRMPNLLGIPFAHLFISFAFQLGFKIYILHNCHVENVFATASASNYAKWLPICAQRKIYHQEHINLVMALEAKTCSNGNLLHYGNGCQKTYFVSMLLPSSSWQK